MGGSVTLAISDRFERKACDEAGAEFNVFVGRRIDAAKDALGEGDVEKPGFP